MFDHTSIKTEKFHPSSSSTKIVYEPSILVIKPRLSNQFQSVSLLLTCQIHFGTMVTRAKVLVLRHHIKDRP